MKRYKIREEKQGAMLFDCITGQSTFLNEKEYQNFVNTNDNFEKFSTVIPRKKLPEDCLSAPSKLYLELTRKCNLKCLYCYNDSKINNTDNANINKIIQLLEEVYSLGTFEVRLTGGEPTLYSHFKELLEYLNKKDFWVSIGSNGFWKDDFIKEISKSCIKTYIFSLDGSIEYNDFVRGKGSYERVLRTIKQLQKEGIENIKLNCVLCKENIDEIEKLYSIAEQNNIQCINFGTLRKSGRANFENKLTDLDKNDMFEIVKKISKLREKNTVLLQTYYDIIDCENAKYPSSLMNKKSCAAGIEVAAISPDLDVYGCLASPANGTSDKKAKEIFIAGNLNEQNFSKIWLNSKKWQAYRNLKLNRNINCLSCQFYEKRCFGNCIVDSYKNQGEINSESPLCFAKLLK